MKFSVSNKSWIVFSTAIVIAIAFGLYFLVYVKNQEKTIVANNFRVLQQIVQNMQSLEQSYLKNAIIRSRTSEENKEVNQNLNRLNDEQYEELNLLLEQINAEKDIVYGDLGIYFKVDAVIGEDNLRFKYFFTSYNDFFNNDLFLRKDVFDQIVITRVLEHNGTVIDRTALFSNEPLGIMDSTFYKKTLRTAKDEITINDQKFISFNQRIDDRSNIFISALILKSRFDEQKRAVSPFLVFTLSISLILIILAMPLLKLKIMSNEERLYIRDVVFSVISVLIGPAIFMVFLYTALIFFGEIKRDTHRNLEMLSRKVEGNFQNELARLVKQIDFLDNTFSSVKDSTTLDGDAFKFDSTSLRALESFERYPIKDNNSYDIQGYQVYKNTIQHDTIFFKHLKAAFWANDSAQLLVLLSAFNQPSYAQDLFHRKYLTRIIDKNPDHFKDAQKQLYEIAIESIKSVNDGSYEIGVGKSTHGSVLPVFAISTKLASVMDAVVEEGYGFCILDHDGNTLFHSDITKNMNENFISETQEEFAPAISSHTRVHKTLMYNGKSQSIYFRPLDCLSGYYIATFVNSDVYLGPITSTMITSFELFLCYLIFMFVSFLILYYSTYKSTKLKQSVYILNFLRPYETEMHFKKYKRLILVSSVVIIYLLFSSISNRNQYDFLLVDLLLVSISFLIFTFYSLCKNFPEKKLMHTSFQQRSNSGFKLVALVIIIIFLLRIVYHIIESHSASLIANSVAGLFVLLLIVLEIFSDKQIFKFPYLSTPSVSADQVQKTYKLYLFLLVIIFSIIPINFFLRMSYENEDAISAKFRNYELLNRFYAWDVIHESEFADKFANKGDFETFVNSMKQSDLYFALATCEVDSAVLPQAKQRSTYHTKFFDMIYQNIRPGYNSRSSQTHHFISDIASDSTWIFHSTPVKNVLNAFPIFGKTLSINQVAQPRNNFIANFWGYILFITAVSIVILLKFLSFTLDRIYGFRFKNYADKVGIINGKTFSTYFLNPEYFSNESTYNNIFIVGINSANTSYVKNYLAKHYKDHFLTLDFYDFSEKYVDKNDDPVNYFKNMLKLDRLQADWDHIKKFYDKPDEQVYILIEHFEFGYNDVSMNKLKLEALKYLIDCQNFKVLVSSEINATKILDYYEDSMKRLGKLLKKSSIENRIELQNQMEDLKIDYKKWQHLLGSFVKCIIPINKFEHEEELAHGEYLDMLSNYISHNKINNMPEDDKILTIQQMSYPYYFSIWNSLSKDERYIIYDIARDRFVNTINSNGIMSLLDKGILVYDHSLRIMNESFTNFVLTKVSSDEALEMEMQSRKRGSWNTAFAVILLLVISLVIFLSIGQQSFLNDLNAFLTAIVALIGLLIRFSGFVTLGSVKPSAA